MTVKVGNGRGKKGDGLKVDKLTKKRTYGNGRAINGFSNEQLLELVSDPKTRAKDIGKINRMCNQRGIC